MILTSTQLVERAVSLKSFAEREKFFSSLELDNCERMRLENLVHATIELLGKDSFSVGNDSLASQVDFICQESSKSDSEVPIPSLLEQANRKIDPLVGTTIGGEGSRFKLLELIGEGATGSVYRAYQFETKRDVAVKVAKSGSSRLLAWRFKQEQKLLGKMNHANIVRAFASGTHICRESATEFDWIAMELCLSRSVVDFCKQRDCNELEVAELFRQFTSALHSIHQKGIIHRDLSPNNLRVQVIDDEPRAILLDLGLAVQIGENDIEGSEFGQYFRSAGTPGYRSPEQKQGSFWEVDAVSDVFSLGKVLQGCCEGRTGWHELSAVAAMATATPKHERYSSALALHDDLVCVINDECLLKAKSRRSKRVVDYIRRNSIAIGLTACAVLWAARATHYNKGLAASVVDTKADLEKSLDALERTVKIAEDSDNIASSQLALSESLSNDIMGYQRLVHGWLLRTCMGESAAPGFSLEQAFEFPVAIQNSFDVPSSRQAKLHFDVGKAFLGKQRFGLAADHFATCLRIRIDDLGLPKEEVAETKFLWSIAKTEEDRRNFEAVDELVAAFDELETQLKADSRDYFLHSSRYAYYLYVVGRQQEKAARLFDDLCERSGSHEDVSLKAIVLYYYVKAEFEQFAVEPDTVSIDKLRNRTLECRNIYRSTETSDTSQSLEVEYFAILLSEASILGKINLLHNLEKLVSESPVAGGILQNAIAGTLGAFYLQLGQTKDWKQHVEKAVMYLCEIGDSKQPFIVGNRLVDFEIVARQRYIGLLQLGMYQLAGAEFKRLEGYYLIENSKQKLRELQLGQIDALIAQDLLGQAAKKLNKMLADPQLLNSELGVGLLWSRARLAAADNDYPQSLRLLSQTKEKFKAGQTSQLELAKVDVEIAISNLALADYQVATELLGSVRQRDLIESGGWLEARIDFLLALASVPSKNDFEVLKGALDVYITTFDQIPPNRRISMLKQDQKLLEQVASKLDPKLRAKVPSLQLQDFVEAAMVEQQALTTKVLLKKFSE